MEPSKAHGNRIQMFGVDIDVVNMDEAVAQIIEWATDEGLKCRYVVTPNVDHAVMLQENEALRNVYDSASLILADGFPIIVASKLLKKPLPERVAGSELVPKIFAAATPSAPLSVYLLGAAEGVADRAAEIIHATWPNVAVTGTYSPPMGFENDENENRRIIEKIAEVQPDILVVGLGAPKQELWVHRHFEQLPTKAALCVGATIDFLAGEKPQAPVWMRRSGLEWVHRMLSEPKRLVKRYTRDAWVFPQPGLEGIPKTFRLLSLNRRARFVSVGCGYRPGPNLRCYSPWLTISSNSMSNTNVASGPMFGGLPAWPYAKSGGMTTCHLPPTFIFLNGCCPTTDDAIERKRRGFLSLVGTVEFCAIHESPLVVNFYYCTG